MASTDILGCQYYFLEILKYSLPGFSLIMIDIYILYCKLAQSIILVRSFDALMQPVVIFITRIVLQHCSIERTKLRPRNFRKRLLLGRVLHVPFISAAFVNQQRIRRKVICSLQCAGGVQHHTTRNACQSSFWSLSLFILMQQCKCV